jgi:hypothetical protein
MSIHVKSSRVARLCVFAGLVLYVVVPAILRAEFQAGVAVVDVTPEKQLPVTGGLGTPGPTTKKAGTLDVRAIVLADADTKVAIVSVPFIGFPSVSCNNVRAKVKGIPPENIMIGSTHTHSAPDMYAFLDQTGKVTADLEYVAWVIDRAAQAINEAAENLRPAKLKIAEAKAEGKIAYNYYAPQLYDPRVNVLQAIDADGKPFATLVNYAIHPEIIGPKQGIISPDMVGPLHDRIAEQGGGTAVFMNGAQGGMVTADCRGPDGKDIQTWEECIRIGNLLADESLRVVKDAPVQENPDVWCGARPITFPVDNPGFRVIIKGSPLKYEMTDDFKVTTQMNLVNVGTAQLLTIPGEALPNIGYYLKRNMRGQQNFLLGLTNDAYGYIMVKEDFRSFDRYRYISDTSLGERTAGILIDEALTFVGLSPSPKK